MYKGGLDLPATRGKGICKFSDNIFWAGSHVGVTDEANMADSVSAHRTF